MNDELPPKALLFVDQPLIFENGARRDVKLIFTQVTPSSDSSYDTSLKVIDVPEMDNHCGKLFTRF